VHSIINAPASISSQQRPVGNGRGRRYRTGRCSDRRRWRVLRGTKIDAARHRQFQYDESYLAHGYKELTIRPGRRFMANGKERASHLATEKFHDDRAA